MYFLLAVACFGIAIPAGNFVPAIVIGGSMGRCLGLALQELIIT